jgi:hypothetical protein
LTRFNCSRIAGQRRDDAVMLKNPRTELYPPSRTIDSAKVFTRVISFETCAVASTGLRGAQNGTRSRSRCCASAGISGIASPRLSATSLISTPAPPETVITPSVLRAG